MKRVIIGSAVFLGFLAAAAAGFWLQHWFWGYPSLWIYAAFWGFVGLIYLAARHALPDHELANMPEAPWNVSPSSPVYAQANRRWREWVDRRPFPKAFVFLWLLFLTALIGAGLYGVG